MSLIYNNDGFCSPANTQQMKYKVRLWQDDTYEVIVSRDNYYFSDGVIHSPVYTSAPEWVQVYKGSLSDCEAYIRLNENGYMY